MQDMSPSNVKLLEVHTREVIYNTGKGRDFLKTPPWKNQRKLKQSRSGMQENEKLLYITSKETAIARRNQENGKINVYKWYI